MYAESSITSKVNIIQSSACTSYLSVSNLSAFSAAANPEANDVQSEKILSTFNKYRQKLGSGPVEWDLSLEKNAYDTGYRNYGRGGEHYLPEEVWQQKAQIITPGSNEGMSGYQGIEPFEIAMLSWVCEDAAFESANENCAVAISANRLDLAGLIMHYEDVKNPVYNKLGCGFVQNPEFDPNTPWKGETIGITVEPLDVRLKPRPKDEYRWNVDTAATALFRKSLSKLSVGVYSRLLREVGKTYRAIRTNQEGPEDSATIDWQTIAVKERKQRESADQSLKELENDYKALTRRLKSINREKRRLRKAVELERSQKSAQKHLLANLLSQLEEDSTATIL